MSLATAWGYTLTELDKLPDMLTENEFNVFTAGKYTGDVRIPANIRAACSAVRNYVGWHLYPSAACKLEEYTLYENGRIKRVGSDLLIQLPAKFVTTVSSVLIGDDATTDFALDTNGLLHVFDFDPFKVDRRTKITVTYTAGLTADMLDGIQEIISSGVIHELASSYGVTSEAAGGVSITYNAGWAANSKSTTLSDDSKEVLNPYRIGGVF